MINIIKNISRLFNNIKLRNKLIVSFSLLAIVPVSILGVISARYLKSNLLDAETNLFTQSMYQLNNSLDYFFQTYMDRTNMAFNSEELQEIIQADINNIDEAVAMNKKVNKLLSYIESDFKYPEIYTPFANDGQLIAKLYIDNATVTSYSIALPLEEYMDQEWVLDLFRDQRVFSWNYGEEIKGNKCVSLNRRLVNFDNGKDVGLFRLYIPVERVTRIIEYNLKNSDIGVFYLDQEQNKITAAGNIKYSTNDYLKELRKIRLSEGIQNVKLGGENLIVGSMTSNSTKWKIVYLIPTRLVTEKVQVITLITILTTIAALVFCIFIAFLVSTFITRRIKILLNKTNEINESNLTSNLVVKGNDEISQLDRNFDKMIMRIRNLIDSVYISQINASKAKLELLQEQINPHLLYNTLSMVASTAEKENQTDIMTVSENLSAFYKGILNRGKPVCLFKEELDMVKRYVEITKYVYKLDIDLILDIDEEVLGFYTLKLIIQPVVENSILHGIRPKKYGTIAISGSLQKGDIIFCISDDGIGMDNATMVKLNGTTSRSEFDRSVGITNIIKRIKIFFGDGYGLKYNSTENEGTTVIITLPRLTSEQAEFL